MTNRLFPASLRGRTGPFARGTLAAIGLLTLAAAPAARAATLTLYSAQHEQTVDTVVKAFTKATGIDVKVRAGEPPELASELVKEGASSPADVFFTANSPELTLLSEDHLLAPVDPATLARVPSRYNAPAGDWVGVLARANVLIFNAGMIKEGALPASLLDLAKPEWKGRLVIAPTDADFLPLVAAVAALKGRPAALEWLNGLRENAMIVDDNEAVAATVERGAAAVGIANNYYLPRLAVEKGRDKVQSRMYYFGKGDAGGLVNISGAGVLKSSRHPKEAQAFLSFLVSTPIQQTLAKEDVTFEFPLVAGIPANAVLRPFDQLQPPALTIQQLSDDRDSVKLLREADLI